MLILVAFITAVTDQGNLQKVIKTLVFIVVIGITKYCMFYQAMQEVYKVSKMF